MSSDKETHEPRYYGLHSGTVVDTADPQGLCRVRLHIPGVYEGDSPWAYPLGLPGAGSAQRGTIDVPPKGSEVGVFFLQGDPERPHWMAGHWGKPGGQTELPTVVKDVQASDHDKVKGYETKRFLVTYDDRPGQEVFRVEDKVLGVKIEIDAHAAAVNIEGQSQVNIKSKGLVSIDGPIVTIAGRVVLRNGKPIQ